MYFQKQIFELLDKNNKLLDKNNILITNVSLKDLPEILKLEKYFDKEIQTSKSEYEYLIKNENRWFLKVEVNNNYVGHISANKINDPTIGYINTLVINKKYQNRGFGTLLLNRLIEIFKSDNITKARLFVQKDNNDAYELYIKLGFFDTGRKTEIGSSILEKDLKLLLERLENFDPKIHKDGAYSKSGVWNNIFWINNKPYRERVEALIFDVDGNVFLELKNNSEYRLPGGGIEKGISNEKQFEK